MHKIIILDHSDSNVYTFNYDPAVFNNERGSVDIVAFYDFVNDYFDLSLKDSECSWMLIPENEPLTIIHY